MAVCGAEVPKMEMMEEGFLMNWLSWLAKVPAMKEPRNTVMTWHHVSAGAGGRGQDAHFRPPYTHMQNSGTMQAIMQVSHTHAHAAAPTWKVK